MIRSQVEQPRDPDQTACAICEAPLAHGPRCDACGAAQRPGGFRPLRLLAQRPHGRVYLAEDGAGRKVVLKELVFHLAPDAKSIDVMERECGLLRAFTHPGVPRLLDVFSEGAGVHLRLYQVQEYVAGQTLRARAESGPLPQAEVEAVARETLGILDALHRHHPPIVHRDVKPENLIRRDDGRIALVDFGAARALNRGETHGATLVGTFGYMPPEQLGGTVSPRSDLYAFGATLLHLLTGKPPEAFLREGVELHFEGAVPPRWRGWLGRLLARSPADRFASASEALAALDGKAIAPTARRRSGRALVLGAGGALLGVLLGLGAVLVTQRAAPPPPAPAMTAPMPADPFAQLERAQVDSARLSALYELLYGNKLPARPLTSSETALLTELTRSGSPAVREKAAQVLRLAQRSMGDAARFDALMTTLQNHGLGDAQRAKAAAAAGELLAQLPQDARTSALADRLIEVFLTDPSDQVRAYAGATLSRVHPLSTEALTRVREEYFSRPGSQAQLLAILIANVEDLGIDQDEAMKMVASSNVHERHLGVVALSRLPLTPQLRTILEGLAKEDPAKEVRTDAQLVLDRAR